MSWLFLAAYTASGVAGLIYEVAWTRLLTLQLGHTTAAASAVVGAFLSGLAIGAAIGGRFAARLTRRRALHAYAALELAVAAAAMALPFELDALTPLLAWAYADGAPSLAFGVLRVVSCALLVLAPAIALGATFPLAIRWFAADRAAPAQSSAMLYAANTAGAAVGALLAGFILIPAIGLGATTQVAMAASTASALTALWLASRERDRAPALASTMTASTTTGAATTRRTRRQGRRTTTPAPLIATDDVPSPLPAGQLRLAATVLALSGFAALVHEITWTRILAMLLGPTTYAFAATLAAVIAGTAAGSWLGTWLIGRTRRPASALTLLLAAAAMVTALTYSVAGGPLPYAVAERVRAAPDTAAAWAVWSGWIAAALVVPTAVCLGAAFTLALAAAGATAATASRRFAAIYAANTVGSVTGSVTAGFLLVPWLGLRGTLQVAAGGLVAAAVLVAARGQVGPRARLGGLGAAIAAVVVVAFSPPWDRALLAGGGYLYAPFVPPGLDLGAMLRAGTLEFYDEGAAATIAVKRLTGTTTLTVDGKTDASTRGDMLTQKLAAHLPLLLHDAPREVAIIGLGSGITVGAALTHPVARADVLELSPEVVAASAAFVRENRDALADPRTRLIVGDGRSHVLLARRQYDVIVSEPSNPWIAGVASLFTREFFAAARARLAPGGLLCQWANAYNIAEDDLRAIVATFREVFPDGTAWLVGEHDVLLVGDVPKTGGGPPLDERLDAIAAHWTRPGVAEDLATVAAVDPWSVQSLLVGGPRELRRYAGGAVPFDDDRLRLEFTAPRELHRPSGARNGAALAALAADGPMAAVIDEADHSTTAAHWRRRGAMFARADAHRRAYDDFRQALTLDAGDQDALDGLVRAATLLDRETETLTWLRALPDVTASAAHLVAHAKLLAASGDAAAAITAAHAAIRLAPADPAPLEQLAALQADSGDLAALRATVDALRALPPRAATEYFAAVARLLDDDPAGALAHAEQAIALDAGYAAVYDLAGAALTRLDRPGEARTMFERSLRFDAHDSSAYANLGLLALAGGDARTAANRFAEALWLDPHSAVAREGLGRALAR